MIECGAVPENCLWQEHNVYSCFCVYFVDWYFFFFLIGLLVACPSSYLRLNRFYSRNVSSLSPLPAGIKHLPPLGC